jgi:hypothetical protein
MPDTLRLQYRTITFLIDGPPQLRPPRFLICCVSVFNGREAKRHAVAPIRFRDILSGRS